MNCLPSFIDDPITQKVLAAAIAEIRRRSIEKDTCRWPTWYHSAPLLLGAPAIPLPWILVRTKLRASPDSVTLNPKRPSRNLSPAAGYGNQSLIWTHAYFECVLITGHGEPFIAGLCHLCTLNPDTPFLLVSEAKSDMKRFYRFRDHVKQAHYNHAPSEDEARLPRTTRDEALLTLKCILRLSFRSLEDELLTFLIGGISNCPTRATLATTVLASVMNKVNAELRRFCSECTEYSLIIDSWTQARTQIHYFGVRVLGLINGKPDSRLLHFEHSDESETGAYLKERIEKVLSTFGLRRTALASVISDSGSNMISCAKLLNCVSVPCAAHMIHNVVNNVLDFVPAAIPTLDRSRSLIAHFRRSHCQHRELLRLQAIEEGRPIAIKSYSNTRWNGLYDSLMVLVAMKKEVDEVLNNHAKAPVPLNDVETELLLAVLDYLLPLKELSDRLISTVVPLYELPALLMGVMADLLHQVTANLRSWYDHANCEMHDTVEPANRDIGVSAHATIVLFGIQLFRHMRFKFFSEPLHRISTSGPTAYLPLASVALYEEWEQAYTDTLANPIVDFYMRPSENDTLDDPTDFSDKVRELLINDARPKAEMSTTPPTGKLEDILSISDEFIICDIEDCVLNLATLVRAWIVNVDNVHISRHSRLEALYGEAVEPIFGPPPNPPPPSAASSTIGPRSTLASRFSPNRTSSAPRRSSFSDLEDAIARRHAFAWLHDKKPTCHYGHMAATLHRYFSVIEPTSVRIERDFSLPTSLTDPQSSNLSPQSFASKVMIAATYRTLGFEKFAQSLGWITAHSRKPPPAPLSRSVSESTVSLDALNENTIAPTQGRYEIESPSHPGTIMRTFPYEYYLPFVKQPVGPVESSSAPPTRVNSAQRIAARLAEMRTSPEIEALAEPLSVPKRSKRKATELDVVVQISQRQRSKISKAPTSVSAWRSELLQRLNGSSIDKTSWMAALKDTARLKPSDRLKMSKLFDSALKSNMTEILIDITRYMCYNSKPFTFGIEQAFKNVSEEPNLRIPFSERFVSFPPTDSSEGLKMAQTLATVGSSSFQHLRTYALPKNLEEMSLFFEMQGMSFIKARGDGNCLFRCLIYLLRNCIPNPPATLTHLLENVPTHVELRPIIVDFIDLHKETYRPGMTVRGDVRVREWIKNMKVPTTWGDGVVLAAAAHQFSVNLLVVLSQREFITIDSPLDAGNCPQLVLAYSGGNHYDCAQLAQFPLPNDLI